MKYLKVHIETPTDQADLYAQLDSEFTEKQLLEIGQDMVNEYASWGFDLVDASDVPEGNR